MATTALSALPRRRWRRADLSLTGQFAVAGSLVMLAAMLAVGSWVSHRIAANFVASASTATALYMDSFVAPLAQELAAHDTLSIGPIRALDELMESPPLKGRVVSVKLWKPDGLVAYARDLDLMGERFPPSESLRRAFAGAVSAELDELDEDESAAEASEGIPLLEIYSPIRATWSGEVIAVAEFYENAETLMDDIQQARLQTWAVVAGAAALIGLALIGIVHRGSRLIAAQRQALSARMAETERIARQNDVLRRRAEFASRRVSELSEVNLRRVSADLHDGPAQQIGFAALRLDAVRGGRSKDGAADLSEVAGALDAAMHEIRQICRGLVLPELAGLSLAATIERAIADHTARTGAAVDADNTLDSRDAAHAVKICAYRFVQEGLANAFRHGTEDAPHLYAALSGEALSIRIVNAVDDGEKPGAEGLGLGGLRERVESLGGSFAFRRDAAKAALEMSLNLETEARG